MTRTEAIRAAQEYLKRSWRKVPADSWNTLHACTEGHPLKNNWQWRNAKMLLVAHGADGQKFMPYFNLMAAQEAVS